MGIYINMEMPTSCDMCWALDEYGDYPRCRITEEQRGYNFPIREKRMNYCPLVSVQPHEDLIDRDALLNKLQVLYDEREDEARYTGSKEIKVSWNDAVYQIIDAPTIIPAEEGE